MSTIKGDPTNGLICHQVQPQVPGVTLPSPRWLWFWNICEGTSSPHSWFSTRIQHSGYPHFLTSQPTIECSLHQQPEMVQLYNLLLGKEFWQQGDFLRRQLAGLWQVHSYPLWDLSLEGAKGSLWANTSGRSQVCRDREGDKNLKKVWPIVHKQPLL